MRNSKWILNPRTVGFTCLVLLSSAQPSYAQTEATETAVRVGTDLFSNIQKIGENVWRACSDTLCAAVTKDAAGNFVKVEGNSKLLKGLDPGVLESPLVKSKSGVKPSALKQVVGDDGILRVQDAQGRTTIMPSSDAGSKEISKLASAFKKVGTVDIIESAHPEKVPGTELMTVDGSDGQSLNFYIDKKNGNLVVDKATEAKVEKILEAKAAKCAGKKACLLQLQADEEKYSGCVASNAAQKSKSLLPSNSSHSE